VTHLTGEVLKELDRRRWSMQDCLEYQEELDLELGCTPRGQAVRNVNKE
jgi:hypothetical protein